MSATLQLLKTSTLKVSSAKPLGNVFRLVLYATNFVANGPFTADANLLFWLLMCSYISSQSSTMTVSVLQNMGGSQGSKRMVGGVAMDTMKPLSLHRHG